jgi:uncharacterized protein YfaS (alpha-2-macroglobulin family)
MAKNRIDSPDEAVDVFAASDRTMFCIIFLNEARKGTNVKFNWWSLDVKEAPHRQIITTSYITNRFENKVTGHITLPRDWPTGTYRVIIYLNKELEKGIDYRVTDK